MLRHAHEARAAVDAFWATAFGLQFEARHDIGHIEGFRVVGAPAHEASARDVAHGIVRPLDCTRVRLPRTDVESSIRQVASDCRLHASLELLRALARELARRLCDFECRERIARQLRRRLLTRPIEGRAPVAIVPGAAQDLLLVDGAVVVRARRQEHICSGMSRSRDKRVSSVIFSERRRIG